MSVKEVTAVFIRRSFWAGTCCFPKISYSVRFLRFCKQVSVVYVALVSRQNAFVIDVASSAPLGHLAVLHCEAHRCHGNHHTRGLRCIQRRQYGVSHLLRTLSKTSFFMCFFPPHFFSPYLVPNMATFTALWPTTSLSAWLCMAWCSSTLLRETSCQSSTQFSNSLLSSPLSFSHSGKVCLALF